MKIILLFWSVIRFGLLMSLLVPLMSTNIAALEVEHPALDPLDNYDWFQSTDSVAMAKEGLDIIAGSARHGLKPNDYNHTTLVSLISASRPEQRAQFNQLLTAGLLSLSHDLKVGRWTPLKVDPDWHIYQTSFDADAFLNHAIMSRHLENHFNLLAPTHQTYLKLMEAYDRYHRYAEHGEWQSIPDTPKLKLGDYHPNISLIQSRLAVEDAFFALTHAIPSDLFDPLMEQAIKRFQTRNNIHVDGIIGRNTLKMMNMPIAARLAQIEINLERQRWMPRDLGDRHILINLANYRLQAFEQDQEQLAMNVVIGKKDRQTPSFSAQMSHMVFNPYWNVPSTLAQKDLLPKQQQDPNYFFKQTIRVFTKSGGENIEVDPFYIDWQQYDESSPLPYFFRQDPGRGNSLGLVKFMFKNPWQIYLHDSPSKSLFNRSKRAYSSGCIRVADPVSLANFSLKGHKAQGTVIDRIKSEKNQGVVLDSVLNIFATYFTVTFKGDDILFLQDIYQRDERMIKSLY